MILAEPMYVGRNTQEVAIALFLSKEEGKTLHALMQKIVEGKLFRKNTKADAFAKKLLADLPASWG